MKKTLKDVLSDIETELKGKMLHGISGTASVFSITEVDYENKNVVLNVQGNRKTWTFERLEKVWNELYYRPAANVEVVFGGSGSSRNQVETIFASLAYVLWLNVNSKKCIAYVGQNVHPFGEIQRMSTEQEEEYNSLMQEEDPHNPLLDPDEIPVDSTKSLKIVTDTLKDDYSLEELGHILNVMYSNSAGSQVCSIYAFGIKYGKAIAKNGYIAKDIISAAELNESYVSELNKALKIYSALEENLFGITFATPPKSADKIKEDLKMWLSHKAVGGFNKIFYGAPGCGKSHHVSQMLKDADVQEENIFRVTFHPEYMNCDFVGQILPSISEKVDPVSGEKKDVVTYQFNPGPFTLALRRAYQTTDMVYLVIEEINRGNAAAIFGDLFQLLDRVKDSSESNYSCSEYPIRNVGVQDYFVRIGDSDVLIETVKKGIFIPGNLTILATMNSSDQNVFTLDTAFKRRWMFEQISNDIAKDADHKYKHWFIPGTDVTWETFLIKLNDEILNYKIQNQTNEDKRLGKYFVTRECLTETVQSISDVEDVAENFAYKIFEYIWNDVCKIGRDDWFDPEKFRTLEDLIDAFVHPKDGANPLAVFRNIDFKAS